MTTQNIFLKSITGLLTNQMKREGKKKFREKNHSTQDSRVVPHRGTNWAALWLTAQIGRDAVLSESYGRGYKRPFNLPLNTK